MSPWAVGTSAQGRISAEKLILVAIVFVSEGAVMPILRVRDYAGEAYARLT